MTQKQLLKRVTVNPNVAGGLPCIRGTRIFISIILDGLAEGLTPEQIIDHYPHLTLNDIHAALAYASELSKKNLGKVAAGRWK